MSTTDNQSAIIERTKEICEEFDSRVAVVGLPFARLELAKALAQSEEALRSAVADRDSAIARGRAEEREACAALAESMKETSDGTNRSGWGKANAIAAAIRVRGKAKE